MSFVEHLGAYWCCLVFAYSPLALARTITLSDLADSYNYSGEVKFGSAWSPADSSMTSVLEEWVRLYPQILDDSPFYSLSGVYVLPSRLSRHYFLLGMPLTLTVFPSIIVDVDSGMDFVGDGALYTNCSYSADGFSYPLLPSLLERLAMSQTTTNGSTVVAHAPRALQPYISIARGDVVPPSSVLSTSTQPFSVPAWSPANVPSGVSFTFIRPGAWNYLGSYSNFHIDFSFTPSEVFYTSCVAPFYPGPIWHDSQHDPDYFLSPTDWQDYMSILDEVGIPASFTAFRGLVLPSQNGKVSFNLPVNISAVVKKTNN